MRTKRQIRIKALRGILGLVDKNFVKKGRASGYSYCCIFWYRIRSIGLGLKMLFTGRLPIAEFVDLNNLPKYQHILCPICLIRYQNRKVQYYECEKCGWHQFENPVCNRCK